MSTIPASLIETVTDHYLFAGLWADAVDAETGEPCESAHVEFSPPDVGNRDRAEEQVAAFLTEVAHTGGQAWAIAEGNPDQAGHDLWLTANHHGAGFWDRGHGLVGDYLTTAAQMIGGAQIMIGPEGPEYVES